MEKRKISDALSFGEIVEILKEGKCACRYGWNSRDVIVMQIPQTIEKDVVPRMTSLPPIAKEIVGDFGNGCISYHDQVLRVTVGEDGKPSTATYYIPTWEDIFAKDWYYIDEKIQQ